MMYLLGGFALITVMVVYAYWLYSFMHWWIPELTVKQMGRAYQAAIKIIFTPKIDPAKFYVWVGQSKASAESLDAIWVNTTSTWPA